MIMKHSTPIFLIPLFSLFPLIFIPALTSSAPIRVSIERNALATSPGFLSNVVPCSYTSLQYIEDNYMTFMLLERRGIPTSAVKAQYESFLDNLNQYIRQVSSVSTNFNDNCMTDAMKTEFEQTSVTGKSFTDFVEASAFSKRSQHYFFLSEMQYDKSAIGSNGGDFDQFLGASWEAVKGEFDENLSEIKARDAAVVSEAVSIFYDPYATLLQTQQTQNYSSSQTIPGNTFLYECLSVVYTLEMLSVSRAKSMQIFSHCVAFLFQTIRMERKEADAVVVSTFFLPMYHGALEQYTKEMSQQTVMNATIPSSVVESVAGEAVSVYMTFDAWGKRDHVDWENGGVVSGESVLFDHEITNLMKAQGAAQIAARKSTIEATSHAVRVAMLDNVQRDQSHCLSAYSWFERPNCTDDENCCATLCDNTAAIVGVGVMSKTACCGLCNMATCDYTTGPLADLDTLHLVPYGYQELDPMGVTI